MTFEDFLSSVLPYTPGCPDAVALDHIVKAARTFCAGTLVWNYTAPPITAAATVGTYTLQLGKGQELVRLLRVDMDGCPYPVAGGVYARAATRGQHGRACNVIGGNDFTLNPTPSLNGRSIYTDVAVKPALGSDYWPDDMAEFVTDIAPGAVSTLLAIPKQEWTDQQAALMHGNLFRSRMSVVGLKVARGFGTASSSAWINFR